MTLTETHGRAEAAERRAGRGWPGWAAVAVWAAAIAAAFTVGWYLRRAGLATEDPLPPLHARAREWPPPWRLLPAAAVAALAVAALPALAARLPWRALPPVAWAASAAWTVALAAGDGWDALARPLDAPTEYPAGLAQLRPDPLEWLRTFTERLGGYTTHVRGHPPLPMLVLWALEKAGLGGTGWAAALVIAAGTSAAAAIAVTVRCLAGERAARAAVPFLALAPLAVWIATAMDAFFLAVAAWGTALLALAARGGRNRALAPAATGGLLLGCLPYLSYGLLPLFAVPLAVVVLGRPRVRALVAAGAGLVVVPAAFTLLGFWWPDGVRATLDTYLVSRGSAQRSYAYFLFANLAVLGLLTGPAVAHALPRTLARLGRGALWREVLGRGPRSRAFAPEAAVAALAGAALLGVLVLDASGVTRGEVERIWVPFAAWLTVAAAVDRSRVRAWLAAQAVTALAVQALVLSPW
ncbi:hypothetical protein BKA00_001945 [Actinomadura coerulea]|uniref:Glycosyltransferase RgtA/B/C/D-like domain-containing protein n=1 Tax=Actinomadura coerulea TaxID=46159 RepID=A0A7X0FWJ7_9ACTN|nr:hypothetical protein [Actinomadura coerulea]MBB6395031.1 hypothetical protein [Actinomadura coerulea]GGQ14299.1 membrane protein [Actinomadura coerulea]